MLSPLFTRRRAAAWLHQHPQLPPLAAPVAAPPSATVFLSWVAAVAVALALLGTLGAKYHWLPAPAAAPQAATAFVGGRP